MQKIIIASPRESAGKTSIAVGIGKALGKKFGYIKPFGDRLIHFEKKTWDYDAALMTGIFGLDEQPHNMSLGFEHSKLRYMYDEKTLEKKIQEMASQAVKNKELLFIETGKDFEYGTSVHLNPIFQTNYVNGRLLVVVDGNDPASLDHIMFIKKCIEVSGVDFAGVIVNKVRDVEDFTQIYLKDLSETGIKVLGIIPHQEQLTHMTMRYLADHLTAKVIAGENGMNRVAKHVFVGALSANEAMRHRLFKKEDKLIITGGDRSDMILAAIETDSAGIILTNNILPPAKIISIATEANIPLLLVSLDTFRAAMQVEHIEPLLTKDDDEKIDLLTQLVKKHVNLKEIIEGSQSF